MTNKPMLSVERELLEVCESALFRLEVFVEAEQEMPIPSMEVLLDAFRRVLAAKPAAQHQGEPVAWLIQCQHSGLVEQSDPNNKSDHPDEWSDAFPVFREHLAPVAVAMPDRDELIEMLRHFANCANVGQVGTGAMDFVSRLNGVNL